MIFSWTDPPLAKVYPSSMKDHWPRCRSSLVEGKAATTSNDMSDSARQKLQNRGQPADKLWQIWKVPQRSRPVEVNRATGLEQTRQHMRTITLNFVYRWRKLCPHSTLNQQHVPMEGFSHTRMPCYFHGFSCVLFDILGTEASTIGLHTIYLIHVLL